MICKGGKGFKAQSDFPEQANCSEEVYVVNNYYTCQISQCSAEIKDGCGE